MSEPSPQEYWIQNQDALEELAWAIDSAAGTFALLLARCNYDSLRHQLVAELQQRVPDLQVLTLPPDTTTLFATIRDQLGGTQPPALMILGLESVTALDPLLASTNQVREEFRKHFPFPLVFWVTDGVLQRLTRLAPDFESWATTTDFTFDIATLTRSLQEGAEHLFETVLTPDSTLSFKRLLRKLNFGKLRLVELDAALGELRQRGQVLPPDIQASLEFFQGVMNPDRLAAIATFKRSLTFWEAERQSPSPSKSTSQISPDLKAALLHFHVGQYLYYQVYRDNARSTDWELTRQSLAQAIALFEQANRPDLVAKCAIHLQRALERTEDWTALEALTQRSLDLYKTYGSLSRLIQSYRHLAVAAMQRQDWAKACEFAQLAWERLAEEPEDHHWQGLYLLTRAKALLGLGDRTQAIALLEQAHHLGDQGHPLVYTEILEQLRQLYRSQQRYLDAFRLKQERQSVEQQYGIRAFVGAGRLQPKREDREALAASLVTASTAEEIALEIRASGRQKDLEQLLERLGRNDFKLIVIHGYSGVGKSSLVNAGLVTALQQKSIGLRRNLPIVLRTYTNWEQELGRSLQEATEGWGGDRPTDDPLSLLRWIDAQNGRSVLVFDQFEEFFFVYPRPEARRSFFQFLTTCLQILSVKVVLSLREDYLHFLLECNQLAEMESTGIDILGKNVRYGLGNFAPADAATIIESLTERAQFYLEPELQEELVTDLAGELGQVRPIELQIVGAQLQAENITTLTDYRQLGENPKQMLVEHYLAEVVDDCGEEHSRLAELVLYLLTDEKGTRPLKTRKDLERELEGLSQDLDPVSLDLVLQVFVESGLVMLLPEVPDDRYQLVHDYLAAFVREQQEPRLTALMAELEQEREQRRQSDTKLNRFLKRALIGSAIAGVGLATLTGFALWSAGRAHQQQQEAQRQSQLAEKNAFEALNKSAEALSASGQGLNALIASLRVVQKQQNLSEIGNDDRIRAIVLLQQTLYGINEQNSLDRHSGIVLFANFSPDGKTLLTLGGNTVKLWNLDGRELKNLKVPGGVFRANFSSDSKTLVTVSYDGTVKLWDLDGKELKTLKADAEGISSVSFSSDSKTLVTVSYDGTVKLRDLNGKELKTFKGDTKEVSSVSFSPDSKTIATVSSDKTVKLWNLNGEELKTLKGHTDQISSVSFSPDSKTITTASGDKTVKLWNLNGEELKTLKGHTDRVSSVSFSPDGKTIATASWDSTIKLWNLNGEELKTFKGHTSRVFSIRFNSDGKTLATVGGDNTVKLWDLNGKEPKALKGHTEGISSISFSPDNKTIAAISDDKTVKLWNLNGKELKIIKGHAEWISSVSFSPDSKTIATASGDKTVKLWNLDGKELKTFKGHAGGINSISFSPDGKTIATASDDKTAKLWNLNGEELKTLKGHTEWISSVSFSPDGKAIATASGDKTAKLWNLNGEELKTLKGHTAWISSIDFSPDSKTIATASGDTSVKLWSLDGKKLRTFKGHARAVSGAIFSTDGKILVTSSYDLTVKFWNLNGEELKTLRGRTGGFYSASLSPDGKTLATTGSDGTVKLWNLDLNNLVKQSCEWSARYLINHPKLLDELTLCQSPDLLTAATYTLVLDAKDLARKGDINNAVIQLEKAKKWNSGLTFGSQIELRQIANQGKAERLIDDIREKAYQGNLEEAWTSLSNAQNLDPNVEIGASVWRDLCWFSSLYGQIVDKSIVACETAVDRATKDGLGYLSYYRDSRGVARTMTGDAKGAIADFESFVKDENNSPEDRAMRQRWIDSLRRAPNRNPFTPEDLEKLRS